MKFRPNHFTALRETRNIVRKDGKNCRVRGNRDRFFFPDEWKAFYDCLKGRQKITFNFLINTGARINEARNIKVSDIDFERRNIVLRVTKRIVNLSVKQRKKRKEPIKGVRKIRVITVSSQFIRYIKNLINEKKLGPEDNFKLLSTSAANTAMENALKKSGIPDWDMFSVHNVRKTAETWLLALGIDSFKIVKHFGHTATIALKHYVSPDLFRFEDKQEMREIIGDLYQK